VARLSGEAEIEPGLTIPNRATPATREATRRYLAQALRALALAPATHNYGSGSNVFARLEATSGTAPHLVLGAHFDTVVRSPGANDNATGVAVVLAVGRALAGLGCRSRPVLLVFFDEEESGLVGSKQFARKLVADGTAVHSVHTADQLGWDANGDRLVELERPDPGLRALYEKARDELGLSFPIAVTTTGGSDHAAFRPTFPAVGLTEGYASGDTSPHRHKPTDTLATVDLAYLGSATGLVARALANLLR
jgi:Zn-dependent M28 family amino/carboxypeptidase